MAIGQSKCRLLLSIDGAALLAQLDRAFGGTGEIASKLPATLPLSADLLAQRVEQAVAGLLTQLVDLPDAFELVERDNAYATLAPFRKGDTLAVLTLEVIERGGKPMRLLLALKAEALAALLPPTEARKRT